MSLIGSPNEASYQSVVTSAEGAVIDVDAVGVAGLPMRTFCTKEGGGLVIQSCFFAEENVLPIVASLLQVAGEGISAIRLAAIAIADILHPVCGGEAVMPSITKHIEGPIEPRLRYRKREMYPHIIGFGIIVVVSFAVDHERAIGIRLGLIRRGGEVLGGE